MAPLWFEELLVLPLLNTLPTKADVIGPDSSLFSAVKQRKGAGMAMLPVKQQGQLCGQTRKYMTQPEDRENVAIWVLYFGETLSLCTHGCDVFCTVWTALWHLSSRILQSILCSLLFLHSGNGFPRLCRLSSSSSIHYKQITSCLLQPEMRKCATICVPGDFFFYKSVRSSKCKSFY